MAAVMPATPTMPTPTAMTMPLPDYQVSGAGAAAAAAPRHAGSGSVGAFFGVLAAVLVLTVLSCVFGRVCAAQAEGPDEAYDCTRLVRRRWRAPRRSTVPAAGAKPTVAPPPPLALPLTEPEP